MFSSVLVVSICLITWTIFTIAIRVYMRTRLNGPWGPDDWLAVAGTIFALVFSGVSTKALTVWDGHTPGKTKELDLSMDIMYLATVATSKISTALLLARLERKALNMRLIQGTMLLCLLWFIAGSIAFGVLTRSGCGANFVTWLALDVSSALLEVILIVIALALVRDLFMPLRSKAVVVLSFSTRLIVIAPIVLRLVVIDKSDCSSTFFGAGEMYTIYTSLVVHVSIMIATFSCIKQFLGAFDSGAFGTGLIDKGKVSLNASSYQMTSQSSGRSGSGLRSLRFEKRPEAPKLQLRADQSYTTTEVRSGRKGSSVEASSVISDTTSEKAIITKTKRWETSFTRDKQSTETSIVDRSV